nr:response regulator [Vibrio mexicanus]
MLLVEDNPVNCLVAEGFLNSLGHSVDIAMSGEEAKIKIKAADGSYDIALLDINLPDCNGVDLLHSLKCEAQKDIPYIAVSAHVFAEEVESYLNAGFDGYLAKPLNRSELAEILNEKLAPRMRSNNIDGVDLTKESQSSKLFKLSDIESSDKQVIEQAPTSQGTKIGFDPSIIEADNKVLGREKMRQIIGLFNTSSKQTLDDLELAFSNEDANGVKSYAHKLKGSCASLGLTRMYELCRDIELASQPLEAYMNSKEALIGALDEARVFLSEF